MSPYKNKKSWTATVREGAARSRAYRMWLTALLVCSLSLLSPEPLQSQEVEEPLRETRFEGYPDAPAFTVVSRKDDLFFYPCDQCHAALEPNPEIRELNVMHDAEITHGRGRIWCMSCHDLENRNYLKTLLDEPVDFDDANLVCGGCHSGRHRDWVFGVHGKRVETWQGERILYDCAHCHSPHSPAIEPRAPAPPPPVRAGLELATSEEPSDVVSDSNSQDDER